MSDKERTIWQVQNCGRGSWEVNNWDAEIKTMSLQLTEEEQKSPYAKYFYLGPANATLENELAAQRGTLLAEEECFMPEDYARIMNTSEINRLHTGYRVMKNGIGFSLVRVKGEEINEEKMRFFQDHFRPAEKDLFYKIWFPGAHLRHYINMAIEDVGCGLEAVEFVAPLNAQILGIDSSLAERDGACIGISGGNGISYPLYHVSKFPRYATAVRYTRDLPDGQETIFTVWHGVHWKDGKSVRMIPENEAVPEADARGQVQHSMRELQTEFRNVQLFWDEQKKYFNN